MLCNLFDQGRVVPSPSFVERIQEVVKELKEEDTVTTNTNLNYNEEDVRKEESKQSSLYIVKGSENIVKGIVNSLLMREKDVITFISGSPLSPSKQSEVSQSDCADLTTQNRRGIKRKHPDEDEAAEQASRKIYEFYKANKQTEEELRDKKDLITRLETLINSIYPGSKLFIGGSTFNGFACKDSDVDACLVLNVPRGAEKATLRRIYTLIENKNIADELQFIQARVSILAFKARKTGIKVDLNINQLNGLRNTHLIALFSKCDKRFPILGIIIKRWAAFHMINSAKDYTLSSYTLIILLIHFLQYKCKPAVLLLIQTYVPEMYRSRFDLQALDFTDTRITFTSANNEPLIELLESFFAYYNNEFDFENVRYCGWMSK